MVEVHCRLCQQMIPWEEFKKHIQKDHGIEHPKVTEDMEDCSPSNFIASFAIEIPNSMLSDNFIDFCKRPTKGVPVATIPKVSADTSE